MLHVHPTKICKKNRFCIFLIRHTKIRKAKIWNVHKKIKGWYLDFSVGSKRRTEVDELHVTRSIQQHVLRLQISDT